MVQMHNPVHPGEILKDALEERGLSVTAAAGHLKISRVTLSRIINSQSGVSAEMAVRLGMALGTGPELWMNMQSQYDLWQASQKKIKIALLPKVA